MKRSYGSAERPADHSADDNKKRRKCDEQTKSASDAHPGDIDLAGASSTCQGDIDLAGATSTWQGRQLMKCIEESEHRVATHKKKLIALRKQLWYVHGFVVGWGS